MREAVCVGLLCLVASCRDSTKGDSDTTGNEITGLWAGPMLATAGHEWELSATLEESGGDVSGSAEVAAETGSSLFTVFGTLEGNTLSIAAENPSIGIALTGVVEADYWSGTYTEPNYPGTFEATRNGAPFPGASPTPTPVPDEEIFVATLEDTSIRVFARTADGNAAPLRILSGGNTALDAPSGIEIDAANAEVLVANRGNDSITVYAIDATGNTAPVRRIAGGATGLDFPATDASVGLYLDVVNNEIGTVSAAAVPAAVVIHARTADQDAAPSRILQGAATKLKSPRDLAVDTANGEIFVADCGIDTTDPARILVFSRTASGDTAPLRWFNFHLTTGEGGGVPIPCDPGTGLGIQVDASAGEVFVTSGAGTQVFARTAGSASGSTPTPLRAYASWAFGYGSYLDTTNDEIATVLNYGSQGGRFAVLSRTDGTVLRKVFGSPLGIYAIAVRP